MELMILFVKINACLAVFALCYQLLFRRLTFYPLNRFYLLASLVLSFVIPLSEVQIVKLSNAPSTEVPVQPSLVQNSNASGTGNLAHEFESEYFSSTDWSPIVTILYLSVSFVLMLRLIVLIGMVMWHARVSRNVCGFRMVEPYRKFRNCSFFDLLFIERGDSDGPAFRMIVRHEREHAVRYHSADKLFVELVQCILWASPLIYYFRRVVDENHEFEVDRAASRKYSKKVYASLLLSLSGKEIVPMVSGLNAGSLRSRINMLFTKPSHKMKKTTYLMALPVVAGLTWFFSVVIVYASAPGTDRQKAEIPVIAGKAGDLKDARNTAVPLGIPIQGAETPGPLRIILDPGHGGKDPGAEVAGIREKDLSLDAALRLKSLLEAKGNIVHLTRSGDQFVSLKDRAKAPENADVLISLHMQSEDGREEKQGAQIFYSRSQKNERVRKKSALLADLLFKQLDQEKGLVVNETMSQELMVLRTPEVPAVLLELGYLSSEKDLSLVKDPGYLEKVADAIHEAGSRVMNSGD